MLGVKMWVFIVVTLGNGGVNATVDRNCPGALTVNLRPVETVPVEIVLLSAGVYRPNCECVSMFGRMLQCA